MNQLPLLLRIKKEAHRKIAQGQDMILEAVYATFEKPILHGGTAIWRCYGGKRFSEDLDFYLPKQKQNIEQLFLSLEKKGFKVLKKKISERSIYSELAFERITIRLEATFQKKEATLADYETVNGRIIKIYSLSPEEFISEKVNAYLQRFKIRDLWDIYFLLGLVRDHRLVAKDLQRLLKHYKKPIDESDLQILILEGIVPNADQMIHYIQRQWEKENI